MPLAVLTPRARSWACGVLTVRREEQGAGARAASSRRERRPQRLRGFEAPQVARPGPGPLEDGQLGADTGVASPGDRAAARNWVLGENPESQQLSEGSTGARMLSLGDTKEDAGASPPTATSFRKLLQPQAVLARFRSPVVRHGARFPAERVLLCFFKSYSPDTKECAFLAISHAASPLPVTRASTHFLFIDRRRAGKCHHPGPRRCPLARHSTSRALGCSRPWGGRGGGSRPGLSRTARLLP